MQLNVLPQKPKYGEPCNGCGICCNVKPCPAAEEFLGATSGRCPALEYDGTRFWCGMFRRPSYYASGRTYQSQAIDKVLRPMIAQFTGVNTYCDALLQGESRRDALTFVLRTDKLTEPERAATVELMLTGRFSGRT
jgi:hypothetical protein